MSERLHSTDTQIHNSEQFPNSHYDMLVCVTHDLQEIEQHDVPSPTFETVLDIKRGSPIQQAIKLWILPHNPEGTVKLLEKLKVDSFLVVPVAIQKKIASVLYPDEHVQTNYFLEKPDLQSMIDFATNKTLINETIHTVGLAFNAYYFITQIQTNDPKVLILGNLFIGIGNIYCILSQRYTRAKLALLISKRLERGRKIEEYNYSNPLSLSLEGITQNDA